MSDIAARFYQPIFGNDNVYAPDVIDLKTFAAPYERTTNAQATAAKSVKTR